MVLWDGCCHVHQQFSLEKILELKESHPDALLLVHPECPAPIRLIADRIGSTAALLKFAGRSEAREFIVATESGILHKMRQECPDKTFIPAPPADSTCACNDCSFMKLNTLVKLRDCLLNMAPAVEIDPEVARLGRRPIDRMLELSARLGL